MPPTRRKFLKTGATAVLFAGFSLGTLESAFAQEAERAARPRVPRGAGTTYFQVPHEATVNRLFYFTRSAFAPHLNTDFTVGAGLSAATLRLVEVDDCATGKDDRGTVGECFALTFRADRPVSDLRTIHVFEHAALGQFSLFVAETKKLKDPDGLYYVAVINHRIGAGAAAGRP